MRHFSRGMGALASLAGGGLLFLGSGSAARADLVLCNLWDDPLRIAVAFSRDDSPEVMATSSYDSLEPGECRTVAGSGPDGGPLYYRSSEPGFTGTGEKFCVGAEEEFYYPDGRTCPDASGRMAEFRRVDVPGDRRWVLRNLDGSGGPGPVADLPVIDLSQPFVPAPRPPGAGPGGGTPPADAPRRAGGSYVSGIAPGSYGPEFELDGFWQGCGRGEDGAAFCLFHSGTWRFELPDGEAYPAEFFDGLFDLGIGTPVTVRGDVLEEGAITVLAVASEVATREDEPLLGLLFAIQGDWAMEGGESYGMRIEGSEIIEFDAGAEVGRMFLELSIGCPEDPFEGPALRTVTLDVFEDRCFAFEALSETRMEFSQRGERFAFVRR